MAPGSDDDFQRSRELARTLMTRHPGVPHYPLILSDLDRIQVALGQGSRPAYEASRSLGVFVVREFEGLGGEYAELAEAIFKLQSGLRESAGIRYWE